MNGSTLTYAEIMSISSNLKSYSATMEQLLSEIKTYLNKVGAEDTWSGTSASEAKRQFDALAAKFPEFYQAVTDTANYLSQVVANYQAADKQVMGSN